MHPVIFLQQIRFGVGNFLLIEELAEVLHDRFIHFEVLCWMVGHRVVLREIEECIMLQEGILKVIGLLGRNFYVRTNTAAAVNRTPAVR